MLAAVHTVGSDRFVGGKWKFFEDQESKGYLKLRGSVKRRTSTRNKKKSHLRQKGDF